MNDKLIFYADGQQQCGPVTLQQYLALGKPATTLVWYEGLDNWMPANQAPLTARHYPPESGQVPPFRPQYPGGTNYGTYNATPAYPPHHHHRPYYEKPDDYLVWAILTTVLCCLPFGVVSIVYSTRVNSHWDAGRYEEAEEASRKAKNWAIASAVTSVVISAIYFLFIITMGVAASGF